MDNWLKVKLSDVLRMEIDAVPVDPTTYYNISGVYSFGRGLLAREPLQGSQTTYKVFHRLHENDFVLSQVKGWEGALARVTAEFDGWFLSPQFPTFRAIPDKLDIKYLEWYCRQSFVWDELRRKSRGIGARRETISPEKFLSLELPLPPLSAQRRIVAHIEALAARIAEARGLRQGAVEEANQVASSAHVAFAGERTRKVGDFLRLDERQEPIQAGKPYPQVGVRGFGQGLFGKSAVDGGETTYRVFNRLYTGAVVLSQVKGWEGAIGVCPSDLDGWYVSPEYRTFSCIEGEAIPEYLALLIPSSWFWTKLKDLSRGLGGRRERVRPELFLALEMPMPDIESQRHIVEMFDHIHELKALQLDTIAELDALLPSVLDRAFRGEL